MPLSFKQWSLSLILAASSASVACGPSEPVVGDETSAAQETRAGTSIVPEVCYGHVTAAGEGQWVLTGLTPSTATPSYQLHAGQYVDLWGASGTTYNGVTYRPRTYDDYTKTNEWVPIRITGTTGIYVQMDYCDRGQ